MKQTPRHHRKQWEFAYILQAIYQRGLMKAGKKALGFAVGTEPLPAILAKHGVEVTATDIDPAEGTEKGWTNGDQLCFGLESLNQHGICPEAEFTKLVHYEAADMNNIPNHLKDYDFTWSACAFEHLGSIEKGLAFVENQMKTLKSGGWAFHSSEFNISSNTTTLETESLVLFRQKDYLALAEKLRKQGHFVEVLDFSLGWMPTDYYVDLPPYSDDKHLRLQIERYVTSSFCLIIQKV
jgi:2-polyprenyl-3-methyl-5-hydroxy-6-metoxy-1,4-benzoquinol methylase